MSVTWIQGSSGLKMPETAVVLRNDDSKIFVGSVLHEGQRVLAQVHPSKKAAYFHQQGQDVEMVYYKILCAPNTTWVKYNENEQIPPNSLLVKLGTESVYIGRSMISPDKIYIGTIKPSEGMSVDFYGESVKLSDCEILVSNDSTQVVVDESKETNLVPTVTPINDCAVTNLMDSDNEIEDEIDTDSGLIEYEELEAITTTDEYGVSLELIEETDEAL